MKIMENIVNDFAKREGECESFFLEEGPFWHLCTPGDGQEMIFKIAEDFKFGITSMAMSLVEAGSAGWDVKLYAFALMSNHVHVMVSGLQEGCMEFFRMWKIRLKRYFAGKVDLSLFECSLIPVENLNSLRYEIAYIHRNGFVNNLRENPFSYEWSTGRYYFNPVVNCIPSVKVSELSYRGRQRMFKSRVSYEFDDLAVISDYVSPLCFCEIEKGEFLFRDAHKYFYLISRSVELYGLIAKTFGDSVFLNDEEMYGAISKKAKELFKVDSLKQLSQAAKIEMARVMHIEYKASNGQIQRMLNLARNIVDELFPKAKLSVGKNGL